MELVRNKKPSVNKEELEGLVVRIEEAVQKYQDLEEAMKDTLRRFQLLSREFERSAAKVQEATRANQGPRRPAAW